MPLDPASFARPEGLLPGRPVTLGGAEWVIPTPQKRLRRDKSDPDGYAIRYGFNGSADPTFSEIMKRYFDAEGIGKVGPEMESYEYLLKLNYPALSDDEAGDLLEFEIGADVDDPARDELMSVVLGIASPKHESGSSVLG